MQNGLDGENSGSVMNRYREVVNDVSAARQTVPVWLLVGFWGCIVIAVAVVLRRVYALISPSRGGPPELAGLDLAFASHATLTLFHIVPALLFVLLTPMVVFGRSQRMWAERLLFPLGLIVALTAYAMSAYAVGGWIERCAVLFFNSLFLFSLFKAFRYAQQDHSTLKRKWLVRAIVILLGIATTRPVMGLFFATSRLTHLTPPQFFGIAFWVGFSINALTVELWLRHKNRQVRAVRFGD